MKINFRAVQNIVLETLKENPITRGDDFLLIYCVYKKINKDVTTMDFSEVMINHKKHGLPSFHTVSRARRKLFEKYPELRPFTVTKGRKELEKEYVTYSRSEKNGI